MRFASSVTSGLALMGLALAAGVSWAEPATLDSPEPPAASATSTDSRPVDAQPASGRAATTQPAGAQPVGEPATKDVPIASKPATAAKTAFRPKSPPVPPRCPHPKPPVYVGDWARLAELTRSDSLISSHADGFAKRNETNRYLTTGGAALGGIAALLGAFDAVSAGSWSDFDKWAVTAGVGVAAVSLFAAWVRESDRDDFLTLINQWNLRHPDQVLAP